MLHDWWFWNVLHRLYWRVGQLSQRVHGHGPLLVAMGDSLTDPFIGFTFPWQVWLRHVGRQGYKTVNLGVGGDSTADMCWRVEEFLSEGPPEIAVLFAGSVDAERGVDPAETERNVTFIVEWLREHGVRKIVLVGPGMLNLPQVPDYMPQVTDWFSSIASVRAMFRDVAVQYDVVFVDLAQFLLDRIARGEDPDFSRVPFRQSRSWHAAVGDGHFNAYGQRLIAEAFLTGTAHWRLGRSSLLLPVTWTSGSSC
jgi:lysophospholipase L1-like esterase